MWKFFVANVLQPLLQALIRLLLMPGLLVEDARARAIERQHGDVVHTERYAETEGGIFCVFILYQPRGMAAHVVRALAALAARGVRIVAVSNGELSPADIALIQPHLHTLIVRRNVGRDFGGYRRGVLHVLDTHQPERLLLLNDSVYYARRGLDAFFAALCGTQPFIGACENYERNHHVGSYALSFGPTVLADPRFRQFWQDYRSTEIRPRVIKQGEIALSTLVMRRMGVKPHLIYSMHRLEKALAAAPWPELVQSAARLPRGYGGHNPLRRLVRDATQVATEKAPLTRKALIDNASFTMGVEPPVLQREASAQYRREMERDMLAFVFRGSQIHWGALLFTQYLDMPIIKLDLLLRSIYEVGELSAFAPYLDEAEYAEFHAMLIARGEPLAHGTLRQKLMMMTGLM